MSHKNSASWVSLKWVKRNEQKDEERETKVSDNNGQLRLQLPPWVLHASRLDQSYHKVPLYCHGTSSKLKLVNIQIAVIFTDWQFTIWLGWGEKTRQGFVHLGLKVVCFVFSCFDLLSLVPENFIIHFVMFICEENDGITLFTGISLLVMF